MARLLAPFMTHYEFLIVTHNLVLTRKVRDACEILHVINARGREKTRCVKSEGILRVIAISHD